MIPKTPFANEVALPDDAVKQQASGVADWGEFPR
jgi:hypothetical protein